MSPLMGHLVNSIGMVSIAPVSGLGLGLLYFGEWWWTVRQLSRTPHPALLAIGSFMGRLSLTAAGVFSILQANPDLAILNLGTCLVVFLGVQNGLVQHLQPCRGGR